MLEHQQELEKTYHRLTEYTLTHGGTDFIHQHVVDAHAAQTASPDDKPIRLPFALVGLLLHAEYGFNGKQVQQSHMKLARAKRVWPNLHIPSHRGSISCQTVLDQPAGEKRDQMIHQWCVSVWEAYADANRQTIEDLLRKAKIL